jgi:predicted 3-demethylubiquinone-9 3-methyltransferase (glyoxalase superfamily)
MQTIVPFLWFESNAEEAANFYVTAFSSAGEEKSKVIRMSRAGSTEHETKSSVMSISFQLDGLEFIALNGGPAFRFSPAISFFVHCPTVAAIDLLWEKLSQGGTALMELGKYPFSERYGWLQDQFGVSWQLNLAAGEWKIFPFLLFVGTQHGKAGEAMKFYSSLFGNSGIRTTVRFGKGEGTDEGMIKQALFSLEGQEFMAMDGGTAHDFSFTPAISLFVNCETQSRVDQLWAKLSDAGELQRCGWLSDRYGVSWQIIPTALGRMLADPDRAKSGRVM